jgi:hypothetical protein
VLTRGGGGGTSHGMIVRASGSRLLVVHRFSPSEEENPP